MSATRRKLIEVALPLEAINVASAHEKLIKVGKPTNLHLWWARRPLAAARAVIFAQLVDDPSAHPDVFPTAAKQEKERQRLFRIMEQLVTWENTANDRILNAAREEIWQSWRYTCAQNADHPDAALLFDRHTVPSFYDPFAGGGVLPLEAQRLGLKAFASDLNPVAVLINKALIEIPPRFAGHPPVNPVARGEIARSGAWHGKGAAGLAEDVRYYSDWVRKEAAKHLGHLYPKVVVTPDMAADRQDLKPLIGRHLTVIAWLWARTVKSPNPAYASIDVPLVSTFLLSAKAGKEAYVEPIIENSGYVFTVKRGRPRDIDAVRRGTKTVGSGSSFTCLMSQTPMTFDYLRDQGRAGRIGFRLMAAVAEGDRGRIYLPPTAEMEASARSASPPWQPELEFFQQALGFRVGNYGMTRWSDLFTPRQLTALATFAEVIQRTRDVVQQDALSAMEAADTRPLVDGGRGAVAYADAVNVYLALIMSRVADWNNALSRWESKAQVPQQLFGRQTISMTWDFSEANPLSDSTGSFMASAKNLVLSFSKDSSGSALEGSAVQADACTQSIGTGKIVSTDPPYYDNIGYADLSDFFYVWLRTTLKPVLPDLFATVAVPKAEELVATPDRHGGREAAEAFFLEGMTSAMKRLAAQAHPAFPVTIYYAFKQSETEASGTGSVRSTGWETFLAAVVRAGFCITGTWPMRTENDSRMLGQGTNALASSIILVCRAREASAPTGTRREFVTALKTELAEALSHLQRGNIAPVDLAQAAIGPGMAVFTRYAQVLDAGGEPLGVGDALALINQTLDEALVAQEGDFDPDTRWALTWFEQYGFAEDDYGEAEKLSKAKNTSVQGLRDAGILTSSRGRVRLLTPKELQPGWDPITDVRLGAWEMVHHLVRALDAGGESGAAALVAKLGSKAEVARELAYRLYALCERKKRAAEALAYNGLVQSFPEIVRLARDGAAQKTEQPELFDGGNT